MMIVLKRITTFAVALSMVAAGLPRGASAGKDWSGGAATAAEAAKPEKPAKPGTTVTGREVEAGQPVLAMGAFAAGYADPDTTEFDFPEDEHKHLVRDIAAWVIASAFVAYFIIKVFIEKDKTSSPDDKPPGKTIP
jgi:hypothetical protein